MATGNSPILVEIEDPACREACEILCRAVSTAGGRALLVGGCVRDAALGRPARELDVEVFGVPPAQLLGLLSHRFPVDLVGRAFGVLKLRGLPIDVTVPRRATRRGLGAEGFERHADPDLTPAQAAARRDFTINAIAFDPLTSEIIDPFGGLEDLRGHVLRHTSEQFSEDPLRVLRGMQLVARFELDVAPETLALCRTIEAVELAPERIFPEWRKLVLGGVRPSLGLDFLRRCDWIRHFPELNALIGCPQDSEWHPEGDVWNHTLHCMDGFAEERIGEAREDLIVGLAVLCHDLGKPSTTAVENGRITSKRHEPASAAQTRGFLARMTNERALIEAVVVLVAAHLAPLQLYEARAGDAAIRRLARRVGRIDRLVRVARADQAGRPPRERESFAAGEWLLERARSLEIETRAPDRIVTGRHLIALGMPEGPELGSILERCYRAQLDGEFTTLEAGLDYARKRWAADRERDPED